MNNYKLIIQYDGTDFSGWQIQKNSDSIQQRITQAIGILVKEDVNLIGSGRTDAGVHALGQVANFRTSKTLDLRKFRHSLNALLPAAIAIDGIEEADEEFHARFDAKKRSYIYLIGHDKSPFYDRYSYRSFNKLDLPLLNKHAALLLGEKDFSSFSRKNTDTKNMTCSIYQAAFRQSKGLIVFYVEANRFLHGMVRTIVGTLLKSIEETDGPEYIQRVLACKDRCMAGEAVPAKGLFLYKVKY